MLGRQALHVTNRSCPDKGTRCRGSSSRQWKAVLVVITPSRRVGKAHPKTICSIHSRGKIQVLERYTAQERLASEKAFAICLARLADHIGRFLKVNSGGVVSVANSGRWTGTIKIGAASGQTAMMPGTLDASSVAFGNGTGSIVLNHTASDYMFAPTITGPGSVLVEAGTTIPTADNSYPARPM
jgi:hypothetical protein